MSRLKPLNFKKWIDEHRHLLKPPVGNQLIWQDREFMVMVVGGPNARTDFHVNEGEEFFYQLEGDITLRIIEDGKPEDVPIREGEIFLLPPGVPHSPQRPAGTVGLVHRAPPPAAASWTASLWFCAQCGDKLLRGVPPRHQHRAPSSRPSSTASTAARSTAPASAVAPG